jgi:hypothetical protein
MEVVQTVVEDLANEVTAAKGVKLVEQYRMSPKLGELFTMDPPGDRPSASRTKRPLPVGI